MADTFPSDPRRREEGGWKGVNWEGPPPPGGTGGRGRAAGAGGDSGMDTGLGARRRR